jgi:peroxiredoxin
MALEYSNPLTLGSKAHPFQLPGVDGRSYSLDDFRNSKGLLIVFMCNHCPYVIAIHERLNLIAKEYASKGIAVIGINSNDPLYKEEDSFENMKVTSKKWGLVFPYVFDESQAVARSYDAVCTPDPYLYENVDGEFRLHYHGRIDDSWKEEAKVKEQSLRLAIEKLLSGQKYDREPIPSMGCSIKWKELTAQRLAEKALLKKQTP